MSHVSVDIVTGFLGGGKTTLLKRVLDGCLAAERVAVVVNEIGEIGIDGRVVTGMDYVENVVELNSGCICCTIDDYRFDLAIEELVERVKPALIIIESTGLADPDPMVYRVKQAGLGLDAVITVVDAANMERALKETTVARAQIEAADFLVLNKVDLAGAKQRVRLKRRLRRINHRALLFECERGEVGTDLLFGTSARRYRQEDAPSVPQRSEHLTRERFAAFSYESPHALDQARFERFLTRLPAGVYRAKGLVRLAGNPWSCLFNYTCGRYELNWVKLGQAAGNTQAVFIGRDVEKLRPRIIAELACCETVG